MNYTRQITITVPATFAETAAAIGRALDPDVGGADSFRPVADTANISVTTPCTEQFAQQVPMMLADPNMLYQAVAADYAKRWTELIPPTLEECTAFCAAVIPEPVAEAPVPILGP